MKKYDCKVAQSGCVVGKAFVYKSIRKSNYIKAVSNIEVERLDKAIIIFDRQIAAAMEKVSKEERELLEAHKMLVHGNSFYGRARSLIFDKNEAAVDAIAKTSDELCEQLLVCGDEYIIARSEDIRGIAKDIISILTDSEKIKPTSPCILVASELSPNELLCIDSKYIKGIVTEKGSPISHVSILAGKIGVPYFYGVESVSDLIDTGDDILLASNISSAIGTLWIDPEDETKCRVISEYEKGLKNLENNRRYCGKYKLPIEVHCNISGLDELDKLVELDGDGVGLFRTEFLFLNEDICPSEEKQFDAYREVVIAMGDKATVIRTMDIGADKKVGFLDLSGHDDDYRGIRVSLANRDIFRTQLRALLRAAIYGNLKLLLPMVKAEWEIDETIAEINRAAQELTERGLSYKIPELGVMIETKQAISIAPKLSEKVDFFSIGTNDLTQSLLGINRETCAIADIDKLMDETMTEAVKQVVAAAHDSGIKVSVCGEMAANESIVMKLIDIGIDSISVSINKVDEIRRRLYLYDI